MRARLRLLALSFLPFVLLSCDVDLFGFGTKEIAAGYRLIHHEAPDQFALMRPHQDVGSFVTEIGWREPMILSRYDRSHPWDVFDTSTNQQVSITDEQRRSDPRYRDIPVYTAASAWHKLSHRRRHW